MLDLKSKLLAAGIVTEEQIARVEHERAAKKTPHDKAKKTNLSFEEKERIRQREELKSLGKNEQYELIRKWVARNRLDRISGVASEESDKFFFQNADGSVSWLTLDKSVHDKVKNGEAGIMAFMSHHGLAHCVMPRDILEDIGQIFPSWIKTHGTL